jgi:hypothetical protein
MLLDIDLLMALFSSLNAILKSSQSRAFFIVFPIFSFFQTKLFQKVLFGSTIRSFLCGVDANAFCVIIGRTSWTPWMIIDVSESRVIVRLFVMKDKPHCCTTTRHGSGGGKLGK